MIRGLIPGPAPWKSLLIQRIDALRPKRGGQWLAHRHYLLFATNARGAGSELWWGVWKAWVGIREALTFQHPSTPDDVSRQPLFCNGEILGSNGTMLGDSAYAFGCLWARKQIFTVHNLWDE
jgi:hypothetical protein